MQDDPCHGKILQWMHLQTEHKTEVVQDLMQMTETITV